MESLVFNKIDPNGYHLHEVWIDLPQPLTDTYITRGVCVCVCLSSWPRFDITWEISQFSLTITFSPHPNQLPYGPRARYQTARDSPHPQSLWMLLNLANPKHARPVSTFFSTQTTVTVLIHSSLAFPLSGAPVWWCLSGLALVFCVLPREPGVIRV